MLPKLMKEFLNVYRDGLLNDTLPFWQRHSVDNECGGFLTFLDADGSIVGTDKPMWVAGRTTWLFAKLYNTVEQKQQWLKLSKHGIDFIRQYGFDRDGRMFYSVTRQGRPLRKRRYLFTETFGVIALAEYAKASGDEKAKKQACDLYRLILRYHKEPNLMEPKTIPQTRQLKSHAMPMILLATSQVLQQIDDDSLYKQIIEESIREVLDDFVKPEFKVLLENVGPHGAFLDEPVGREVNPGHAIETSWFIMEQACSQNNNRNLIDKACRILDWSLDIGWDKDYGGIYYFRDCKGKSCPQYEHDMKLWWPHNEAIYATLLAYYLTGNQKYALWHRKIHDWAYAHFPDKQNGEWFGYLHRDGTVSSTLKGNMWKGPFHLPRMQLNCWKLLGKMTETKSWDQAR
ncbi:MAG: AGE family epimerase/isomerase [Planctomycetota bacterium]